MREKRQDVHNRIVYEPFHQSLAGEGPVASVRYAWHHYSAGNALGAKMSCMFLLLLKTTNGVLRPPNISKTSGSIYAISVMAIADFKAGRILCIIGLYVIINGMPMSCRVLRLLYCLLSSTVRDGVAARSGVITASE